eukprot:jgi/Mesvir1/22670/Mv14100-RA.1
MASLAFLGQAPAAGQLQSFSGGWKDNAKVSFRRPARSGRLSVRAAAIDTLSEKRDKILIAGGGIGGLSLALAFKRVGLDSIVFERVREYKPFGGPIQLQCNALGALESICPQFAQKVIERATITGDRLNGLVDGVTGDWYCRFDVRRPCRENGLPLTLVISRYELLELLTKEVGQDVVQIGTEVVGYEQDDHGVTAILSNGQRIAGNILVGADGIRSKVRQQMRGDSPQSYSTYTVYTGIAKYTPPNLDKIGYQVFLGELNYFVASDVGDGLQQWYAFHECPAGGVDTIKPKDQLLQYYDGWCDEVINRIKATPDDVIERRDVYDVIPSINGWASDRVALLGDAIHAVQPNLGQGGGQAIESAFTLANELAKLNHDYSDINKVRLALWRYTSRRVIRCGSIHGLSRMASLLNTVYRPYLGSQPYSFYPEPVQKFWLEVAKLKIPHPGRVVGQIMIILTIQAVLEYVGAGFGIPDFLGGPSMSKNRIKYCQVPGISAPKRPLTDDDFKMKGIPGFAK